MLTSLQSLNWRYTARELARSIGYCPLVHKPNLVDETRLYIYIYMVELLDYSHIVDMKDLVLLDLLTKVILLT